MAAEHTEEKQMEYHKKKSQRSNITTAIDNYDMSTLQEDEESTIISLISTSIRSSNHILFDKPTSIATRNYYERIVNDQRTTFEAKKFKIYIDLVMGSKTALKLGNDRNKLGNKLQNENEILLNYKLGTQTENICTQTGCVLTVGRYKDTDICLGNCDLTISRIQCFILIIENNIIILDGWSYFGTKTIQINGNKNSLQNSMPNKRCLLRFNKNDCIHLRFGESNTDLIINPKQCIVCMDKSRTIRNKCGHLILCSICYKNILSSVHCKSSCPICRLPISIGLNCNENDDLIKSYCKPVAQ